MLYVKDRQQQNFDARFGIQKQARNLVQSTQCSVLDLGKKNVAKIEDMAEFKMKFAFWHDSSVVCKRSQGPGAASS